MKEETAILSLVILSFICGLFASFFIFPSGPVEEGVGRNMTGMDDIRPVDQWDVNRTPRTRDGVKTYLIGVTEDGRGVVDPVWVEAKPGSGKTMVNIETLFFWVDTQYSIRAASQYARKRYTEGGNKYDLTYSVITNSSVVGGPSAGAVLTVATIAALENKTLKQDVAMTGSIEKDGSIGKVGDVLKKAEAAERMGFDVFLIPEGQKIQTDYVPKRICRSLGNIQYCTVEYREDRVNVDEEVGIKVVEVKNITQALDYFIA